MPIKGLLGRATRTHDLAALADEFSAPYFARWQKFVPGWIIDRLKEIAAIDLRSTAFRYGDNFDPALKAKVPPVPSACM